MFPIILVDLEGDLALSVRDTGPQVLLGEDGLEGVEDYRPFVQLVQDRLHSGAKAAGAGQTPEPPPADQLQALVLIQALQHARLAPPSGRCAASAEAPSVIRHGSAP